jgi:DNA-binding MarR family transcriptional regulator
MIYNDVSFILGSPLCKKILETLNSPKEPLAPVQISKMTKIQRTNVSKKLIPLVSRKLVKCINPESRKWRFYVITDKGKEVLKQIDKMKK